MNRLDPIPIIIGIISVFFIGLIFVMANGQTPSETLGPTEPVISGEVSLTLDESVVIISPEVHSPQHTIYLKNSGQGTAILSEFRTSSDAISFQYLKDTQEPSPAFTHNEPSAWRGFLQPDEGAYLTLAIDDQKVNWENEFNAYITFTTNDPDRKTVKIAITTDTAKALQEEEEKQKEAEEKKNQDDENKNLIPGQQSTEQLLEQLQSEQ